MRTFYKQILDRTYEIFGSRQTENMDEDQIVFLLNALENVSKMYAYIPEEQQKAIINKRMITDKEYKNINVRLIAGWFEQDGKIFFKEVAHVNSEPTAKPLEGEERDKAIEEYLKAIAMAETNFTNATKPKGSGSRLRESITGSCEPIQVIQESTEPPKPTFFCVMNNGGCKEQCGRCKSESEILSPPKLEDKNV